jgi:hypothetical protein
MPCWRQFCHARSQFCFVFSNSHRSFYFIFTAPGRFFHSARKRDSVRVTGDRDQQP